MRDTYVRITEATDEAINLAAAKGVEGVLAVISEEGRKDPELLQSNLYFARLFAACEFHIARDGYWRPSYDDIHHPRLLGPVYNAWVAAVAARKEK